MPLISEGNVDHRLPRTILAVWQKLLLKLMWTLCLEFRSNTWLWFAYTASCEVKMPNQQE